MFALTNTLAAAGFVPARLEANMLAAVKQAGGSAWYVPDDFLVLGPNIFENGDFSQGSAGWNPVAATFSVANGEATVTATSTASPQIYKSFPAVPGRSYLLSFEAKNISATDVRLHAGGILATSSSTTWTPMRGVINAGSASPNLVCLLSASAAGQQGAFRNVEVREILSAKDFQDNQESVPSFFGGTVGALFDAAGLSGSELIANSDSSSNWVSGGTTAVSALNGADSFLGKDCLSVTFPTIASGGYIVCRAQDAANTFRCEVGKNYVVSFECALSRDLIAGESVTISFTGSVAVYARGFGAGSQGNVWSKYSGGGIATTTGSGNSLRPYAIVLNSPLTVYIRNVSVKESGGVVVSQATAGNRPTITRIPRKLGPELVGSGVTGWAASGSCAIAVSAGTLTISDASPYTGFAYKNIQTSIGKTYVVQYQTSGAREAYVEVRNASNTANLTTTLGFTGSGFGARSVMFTADAASPIVRLSDGSSSAQSDVAISAFSVREVLEWSYALTFDGSNDSLAAPASIIGANLSNGYTMISWGWVGALGASRIFQGDSARYMGLNQTGLLTVVHTGATTKQGATPLQQGAPYIAEAVFTGTQLTAWLNNVQEIAPVSTTVPTGAAAVHCIGQSGLSSGYFNGVFGGCVVCPAVMSDAQRLAVRKFAAAQLGMSL